MRVECTYWRRIRLKKIERYKYGVKEYLLCGECEAKRSKWETYFSNKWHRGELFGGSDPYRSEEEERYLLLGMSLRGRLLVVSFAERPPRTRLISAREATRHERRQYEEGKD
ncbi:MAG TPA: BrnT family toxin [Candidatus Binatia bacterium]|nr:BrnT family toxin [Candidatus Binatia bacterium]